MESTSAATPHDDDGSADGHAWARPAIPAPSAPVREAPPAVPAVSPPLPEMDWSVRRDRGLDYTPALASPPARGEGRAPRWRGAALLALAAALVSGVTGGVIGALLAGDGQSNNAPIATSANGPAAQLSVEQTSAITEVAGRTRPSIVRIVSSRAVAGGTGRDIGSGVVIDAQGTIVTNQHVIAGTEQLRVMVNGEERSAIVVGHDFPFTDVAVLRTTPGGLVAAEIGDSERLTLGESVVAIGNPLGELDGSVSTGVVSGLKRQRVFDNVLQEDLIQTDAALNQGNSGGGLFNLRGQFVGMPTALIRASARGAPVEGIGFALPSNRVLSIARRIIEANGSIARPDLGIEHLDLTPEVASRFPRIGLEDGAVVVTVAPGGPANAVGIVAGDVITSVGGQAVSRQRPLLNAIMDLPPGQPVRVVLNRGGRIIEAEVRLGRRS